MHGMYWGHWSDWMAGREHRGRGGHWSRRGLWSEFIGEPTPRADRGGVRYLVQGGLCYSRRARMTGPQCASPGNDTDAGDSADNEARGFLLQWQQRHHSDGAPRVSKDRAVNGRHSARKPRANRR